MQLLCLMPTCRSMNYALPVKGMVGERGKTPVHEKQKQGKFLKDLAPPLMAAVVALSPICNTPDIQRGAALFGRARIGCHDAGGNIIQPGATFFLKDLQRNGVDTEEEIYRMTYYGKGRMPGFGENCTPRRQCRFGARLQEEEIKLLAEFVKGIFEKGNRGTKVT
ncbi:hypothetical protein PVL29_000136 [Vitis rotundifolia]|uniref:Cytochrome c-553 n=1 Tax=Vitis rotundifolia TaxID=103349 RepID=A0AA39E4A5_VITRO|nr:hypothetical protein PVL29_000136 [Vitis rotundifolia]